MPESEEIEPVSKLDKAKEVIKNNWKPFTVGVVLTGVTFAVTRQLSTRFVRIDGTLTYLNSRIADEGPLYKVFKVYTPGAKHHGPSWMIKCKETGKLFVSQEHAARKMGLSKGRLSTHLNGNTAHVKGYHFERVGIAT